MNIDMKPTAAQRRIIKAHADYWGIRYRITRWGEVHFFGRMPNSRSLGWWLFAETVDDALRIIPDRKPISLVLRRSRAPEGECKYCDKLREENITFAPPHDASANCQSGKRPHCSCDTCF